MRRFSLSLALFVLLAPASPLVAQTSAPPPDSTPAPAPLFTRGDAYLAAGFLAAAALLAPLDRPIARELQEPDVQTNDFLDGAADVFRLLGLPGTVLIGGTLYLAGRIGDLPTTADIGLHTTEATLLALALTTPLKGLIGRARPDTGHGPGDFELGRGFHRGDDFQALPSGHTTAAFAAAAALAAEATHHSPGATRYVAPLGFTAAALVGFSRMYDNRHWATDVSLGAAIGTFSGLKVARYHHSRPDNPIDRWLLPAAILPAPRGGLAVAWSLAAP
jgi:membrane-associated phospholipid phosphatase